MPKQIFKDRLISEGDLLSAKHDDLMILLDSNVEGILKYIWKERYKDYEIIGEHQNKANPPDKFDLIWEYPITTENKYYGKVVIGFIDLLVMIDDWWVGYENNTYWQMERRNFLFEVKTKINSLGELIRQINLYRTYENGKFIIFSPDDKYKKQINSQGIWFYTPDDLRR